MSAAVVWASRARRATPGGGVRVLVDLRRATTRTTTSRDRNLRAGPLPRCHHHVAALAVRSHLYGVLAALGSVLGFLIWHAAYPGPVLPRLVDGLLAGTH